MTTTASTASTNSPAAHAIERENFRRLHAGLDALFSWALLAQWLVIVALALLYSPTTWIGASGSVHIHLWASILLGALCAGPGFWLGRARPGDTLTRYAIAVGQAGLGSLLIHVMGGAVENHFHVFISLALLASYRDLGVILAATGVIAADHLARGLFYSTSLYGVTDPTRLRWLVHAVWVVIMDAGLYFVIARGRAEMRRLAQQQADAAELSQSLSQGVQTLVGELQTVAQSGDLARRLPEPPGHLQPLAQGVNGFIGTLQGVIGEVVRTTASFQQTSERVAAATEQMDAAVTHVTQQAATVADLAQQSANVAGEGAAIIGKSIHAAQGIGTAVEDSATTVKSLGERSSEIIAVVQTIRDIADQTNLLALNAAIEAARAGEHGRGFAVVADEVRKLADRTATATQEISTSIQRVREDTLTAVGKMDHTRAAAEQGAAAASTAGESLQRITTSSQGVAERIAAINQSVSEVKQGSSNAAQAVTGLAADIQRLNDLVRRFKVN